MAEDFLDLFVPKKPRQGPPAPPVDPLDQTFKSLGVKGGLRQVQERNAAVRAKNQKAKSKEARKAEASALSTDDESLVKSILFMSSKDEDGVDIAPTTAVDDLQRYKPSVSAEEALNIVKDPAKRKVWEDARQRWRNERQGVASPDTGPVLRRPTPQEEARIEAEDEAARVPLGEVGRFQQKAEEVAGQVGKWLPTPGGEQIARGAVSAALSPFSSAEMMVAGSDVPDFDKNKAAADFFISALTAMGGGGFIANFTRSGGSVVKGVIGAVAGLKKSMPEMASKIDEAASVISKLPEQEADDLLRQAANARETPPAGALPEDVPSAGARPVAPATPEPQSPGATGKEPWQMTRDDWSASHPSSIRYASDYPKTGGQPKEVYHGSRQPVEWTNGPAFVTLDRPFAEVYSGNLAGAVRGGEPHVYEGVPSVKNPLVVKFPTSGEGTKADFELSLRDAGISLKIKGPQKGFAYEFINANRDAIIASSKASGYDGVQFNDRTFGSSGRTLLVFDAKNQLGPTHRQFVAQALAEGKPVPPEVLADYPDLAKKYGTVAPEPPQTGALGTTPTDVRATPGPVQEPPVVPQADVKPRRTVKDVDAEIEAVLSERRARIEEAASGGRMNASSGLDPSDLYDAYNLGRLYFERGLRSFDDWARQMIAQFGKAVKPHLADLWRQVDNGTTEGPVSRVQAAMREAKPLRSDVAFKLSEEARAERGAKLGQAQERSVGKPLDEAMADQMASQKGSYANYSFELPASISPEDLADLKDMVLTHPGLRKYDKLNAQSALEKIAGDGTFGGLPTPGELALLDKVFGRGFSTSLKTMAKPSLWDELMLHRKWALLSNPRTVIRNLLSNSAQAGRGEGFRQADFMSDQIVRLAFPKATGGRRTVAFALGPSWERSKDVFAKTARDVKDIMADGMTWEGSAEVLKESRNPLVKYGLRFQGAQDAFWMNAAYERSLFEQASLMKKADPTLDLDTLLNSPTEAMEAQALLDSQIATFNAPNKMVEALGKLSDVPIAGHLVDLIVPFKKVPTNIASELAQANPVGALVNWALALKEVRKTGTMSYAAQRHLAKATTNGALGTGLLWLGYDLARRGLLTGAPPPDPSGKTTNEALNVRPMSIEAGGARYQLTGMHPMLSVIALGGSMYESAERRFEQSKALYEKFQKKGQKPEDFGVTVPDGVSAKAQDAGSWAVAAAAIMQEQPFLKGLKDLTDAAKNENSIKRLVTNYVGSFAPTVMNDVMRLAGKGDSTVRNPQTPWDAFRARAGFGQDVPARHDAFGREVKFGGVFDVTNAKEVRTDPVSLAMRKHGLKVTKLERFPNETSAHYEERQKFYGMFLYRIANDLAPSIEKMDKATATAFWESMTGQVRGELGGGLDTGLLKDLSKTASRQGG